MAPTIKTNRQGQRVVYGTTSEVRIGQVMAAESTWGGRLTQVQIVSLGRPFTAEGREMVYGYLTQPAASQRPARTRSSYGNPRPYSCEDCQDIEDMSDGRGCARHRGNPQN